MVGECPRCGLPIVVVDEAEDELEEAVGSDVQVDIGKPDGSISASRLFAELIRRRLMSMN